MRPPPDGAAATTSRSVLRGGAWYAASYGVPQLYIAVTSILAARFLGKHDFGQQSFIALNSILLATVLSSSMYAAVMRHVGESVGAGRSELLRSLLGWAWRIEAVAAGVPLAVLGGAALAGAHPGGAWVLAGVVSALSILHTVPTAVLIGLQQIRRAATVGLTTGFVSTIATAIVLWQGGGITGMFAVEAAVSVVNLIWTSALARRSVGARVPVAAGEARRLQRRTGRFALVAAGGVLLEQVVAARSEFYFLKAFSTEGDIALYSISFSMVAVLGLVPSVLGDTLAPAFATLFGAGRDDRIRSGFTRAVRLLLVVSLPLAAAAIALGPEFVHLLYGREYEGVAGPLRIMAAAFPVVGVAALATAHIVGIGRVRVILMANALAAVVDLSAALALVPLLDATGAALANSAAQVTYALVLAGVSARILGAADWRLTTVLPSLVAAGVACAAGWIVEAELGGLPGFLAGGAVLVVVYLAAALALGLLAADDARWLEAAVGGRLGRRVGRLTALVTIRWERS